MWCSCDVKQISARCPRCLISTFDWICWSEAPRTSALFGIWFLKRKAGYKVQETAPFLDIYSYLKILVIKLDLYPPIQDASQRFLFGFSQENALTVGWGIAPWHTSVITYVYQVPWKLGSSPTIAGQSRHKANKHMPAQHIDRVRARDDAPRGRENCRWAPRRTKQYIRDRMQVSSIEKPKKAKNIRTVRETHYASEFSASQQKATPNPFFALQVHKINASGL